MGGPGEGVADVREAAQQERGERISKGLALIRAGETYKFAAESSGIPASTLSRYYQKILGPNAKNRDAIFVAEPLQSCPR